MCPDVHHLQAALVEVEKVLNDEPGSAKAILMKAEIMYGMGLFEKALSQYYKGMRINPRFENNVFQSGMR